MTTITGTINHYIVLSTSGAYVSPLTITNTGAVESTNNLAIYGPNTQPWTVVNNGKISAGANDPGIALRDGGYVGNSGSISGGIGIYGAGSVNNSGTISASGILAYDGAISITNTGVIIGKFTGVQFGGGTYNDTLVNAGTIESANPGAYANCYAVDFNSPGNDRLIFDPGRCLSAAREGT